MGLIGAVEAGGTKFICAVGTAHDQILARETIETTNPEHTLAQCVAFFKKGATEFGEIKKLGVAAFGPLDLKQGSPTYGALLNTPKPGWSGFNMPKFFQENLGFRCHIDTDVNAAVLAEVTWGAAQGCSSAVYVTIGTGIGAGVYLNGKLLHGLIHPEIGHIAVPRAEDDGVFAGVCPFHGDCLEGLASGPAVQERWGQGAATLPQGHDAWKFEAYYLAQLCRTITLAISPERIILGGGLMAHQTLIRLVHFQFDRLLGDYLPVSERAGGLEKYIVRESFKGVSGLAGAFALAGEAMI